MSLVFFNFLVPAAGRDNVRQSALDFVSLLKVAQEFDFEVDRSRRPAQNDNDEGDEAPPADPQPPEGDAGVPLPDGSVADATLRDLGVVRDAGVADDGDVSDAMALRDSDLDAGRSDATSVDAGVPSDASVEEDVLAPVDMDIPEDGGAPIVRKRVKLDPDRVLYMGHSQGGLNGPLFLAVEPNVRGAVLSAAGAQLSVTLEQKTEPIDINAFVQQVVPFEEGDDADRWHPVFSLLQTFIEPGDPVNYAAFWFRNVPAGYTPKHILMTAGLEDQYTPPDSIFALAAAGGVPIVEPVLKEIELFEILGVEPAGIPPYANNVADGRATAGIIQLDEFGHFAIQRSNTLRNRYRRFIESVLNGAAQVY